MDLVRYILALLVVMGVPGAVLYWLSIHGLIGFWRRLGARWTFGLHLAIFPVVAFAVYRFRESLLAVDFGTNWWLVALSLPVYALTFLLGALQRRELKVRTLIGLPEMDPGRHPTPLVTGGIYSRVRHPRYLELTLAVLAHALLTNHLAVWAALALWLLALLAIIPLEERELRARYGPAYAVYTRHVPRLLPRFRD